MIALTGTRDDNTSHDLARHYVEALRARGVDEVFDAVADESHNGAFRSPEVFAALRRLLPSR